MKCPAKCANTKECFGSGYFMLKTAPAKQCDGKICHYPEELKAFMERKEKRYY